VDALPYNPADVTYALAKRVLCLLRSLRCRLLTLAVLASLTSVPSFVIIAETTSSSSVAERALADLAHHALPVDASPRVVETASVPGLVPGFRAVVFAWCPDEKRALDARDLAQLVTADAYVRRVDAPAPPDACPRPLGIASERKKVKRVAERKFREGSSLRWWIGRTPKSKTTCEGTLIRLLFGETLLAEHWTEDTCKPPESGMLDFVDFAELRKRRFPHLALRRLIDDHDSAHHLLFGFACGRLDAIASFDFEGNGIDDRNAERTLSLGDSGRLKVEIERASLEPSTETKELVWKDCGFR